MVIEFTEHNFDSEVIRSKEPVLVDFWASWCMPCKLMSPVVDELAKEFKGRVKVGKTNVDDNPGLATKLSVMNIPTLIVFKGGKEAARIVGVNSKASVTAKLEGLISA